LFGPGVGDGDTEDAGRRVKNEGEPEVASLNATVEDGVGREFGDDLLGAFGHAGWHLPDLELPGGEETGQARRAARGGQRLVEHVRRGEELGSGRAHGAMVVGVRGCRGAIRSVR
jgi:hypothetical protein